MSAQVRSVAVLGTGIMGAAIAHNLAAAGIETRAWNRSPEKAEPLSDDGITVAESAAEAARGADAVITMLADADAVLSVMTSKGAIDAMSSESIWLQMSTIGREGTDDAMALADRSNVLFVDAPVVGTKQPAEEGKLMVLASGPEGAIDACEPVFSHIAARTVRLGGAGAGTRMKLVVNTWLLALTTALAETLTVAEEVGVDAEGFLDVIDGSPIDVAYAHVKGKSMLERDYEPSFPLRLAVKDARLVLEAADGVELPLTQVVEQRYREASEMGLSEQDVAAVYEATSAREDARPGRDSLSLRERHRRGPRVR
jgi:3-hydroxyisobutyrate dehydrogenase